MSKFLTIHEGYGGKSFAHANMWKKWNVFKHLYGNQLWMQRRCISSLLPSLAIYIDWLDIVIPRELVDHFGQYNQGNLHLFTQPNPITSCILIKINYSCFSNCGWCHCHIGSDLNK